MSRFSNRPRIVKRVVPLDKLLDQPIKKLPDQPNKDWARYWHDTKNDVAFITSSVREHKDCEANIHVVEITRQQYNHDFIEEDVTEEEQEMDTFMSLFNEPRKF